jgi:protein gp37
MGLTTIEWTWYQLPDGTWVRGYTFNPWWGCSRVSEGCEHCYAETMDRRIGGDHWGPGSPRRVFGAKYWARPLVWNEEARLAGERRRVFCASMADILDLEGPASEREKLWQLIRETPHLDWLLLSKRPQHYERFLPPDWPLTNAWLGVTAENQRRADERLPILVVTNAVIRFVSVEPLLEPVDLSPWLPHLDWVIVGAESGHGARPMEHAWVRALRDQCDTAGVSFFYKQDADPRGRKLSLPVLDGRQHIASPT